MTSAAGDTNWQKLLPSCKSRAILRSVRLMQEEGFLEQFFSKRHPFRHALCARHPSHTGRSPCNFALRARAALRKTERAGGAVTVRAANALTHVALRQRLSIVDRKQCSPSRGSQDAHPLDPPPLEGVLCAPRVLHLSFRPQPHILFSSFRAERSEVEKSPPLADLAPLAGELSRTK